MHWIALEDEKTSFCSQNQLQRGVTVVRCRVASVSILLNSVRMVRATLSETSFFPVVNLQPSLFDVVSSMGSPSWVLNSGEICESQCVT